MMKKLLLPHKWKKIGWILFIPATVIGIFLTVTDFDSLKIETTVFALISDQIFGEGSNFGFIQTNITPTLIGVLFIIGALLVGFSKEKQEDEFIANLRLTSLLWAVLVNYIILLLALLFIWGTPFWNVMLYTMFTVLIIFIVR